MGAVVVVAVGESVDQGVELPAALGQGVDGMELVAPGGLHAFDAPVELGAVELGAAGREGIEGDAVLLAGVLEVLVELGTAVDLAGADGERGGWDELVEEAGGGSGGGHAGGAGGNGGPQR